METIEQAAGYGDIQIISPYNVQHINELRINIRVNEHAQLYLTGVILEETGVQDIESATGADTIEIQVRENDGHVRTLFHGLVSDFHVKTVRGIYYFELEGLSHTWQLDWKRKTRSFQHEAMTYEALMKKVLQDYEGSDLSDRALGEATLDKFVLQYEETDWTFMKRLASRFGAVLIPETTVDSPKFWVGVPEGAEAELMAGPYKMRRRLDHYEEALAYENKGLTEADFTRYVVSSIHPFQLGDNVRFQEKAFKVASIVAEMKNGLLTYQYELSTEKGIRQNQLENKPMIGASLEGSILEVKLDTVRIHLDIDDEQEKEQACWFPYATMYSAEGNSGFHCMPEVGDPVQLYIPSSDEADAVAMSTVRRSGQDSPKLADPSTKYWGTNDGKEMKLSNTEVKLTAKADKMFLKVSAEKGVQIQSDKTIRMKSNDSLTATSATKMDMKAKESIYLVSSTSSMMIEEDIDVQGRKVFIEGQSKEQVHVDDLKPPPTSMVMSPNTVNAAAKTITIAMNLSRHVAGSIPKTGGGNLRG